MTPMFTPHKSELKQILLSFRKNFLFVVFFSMFINILLLTHPAYMIQVYDRVLASRSVETLVMLTLILVWLFITMGILDFIRSRILIRIGTQIDNRLNTRLFRAMNKSALRYPDKNNHQPLRDLTSVRKFMTGNGIIAIFDLPWVPFYFTILFLFHPWLGWFAVFAAATLIIVTSMNHFLTKNKLQAANTSNIDSMTLISSQLRNAETVHAMGMQKTMEKQWLEQHLTYLEKQSDASDASSLWTNISKTLQITFTSLTIGLAAYLVIFNEISAGMIIAAMVLTRRALSPIHQMIGSWRQLSSAKISYKRLEALLSEFPEESDRMTLPPPKGALHVEALTVAPPNSRQPVLKSVSFSIEAGESLVLLGSSAAGKSSLLRAIVGIWPSLAGTVRIDGTDIFHWNREDLGDYIGYLPQNVELFDGTIADNISRFKKVNSDKVIEAANIAGIDEMIRRLPEGYETRIGIGGANLSGGQRQRIGFARAVYDNPSLVILDEPNASLDEAGVKALIKACKHLKEKGTTLVFVTHRTNILSIADKILVLADGMVSLFGDKETVFKNMAATNIQQQTKQKLSLKQQLDPATDINQ